MTDEWHRRRTLASLGTGLAAAVAGCIGTGPESTDDGPEDASGTTPTASEASTTPTDGAPADTTTDAADATPVSGVEGDSDVSGMVVTAVEERGSEEYYTLHVTVENTGEQSTDPSRYGYDVTLYDADGADVTGGASGKRLNEASIAAGERAIATITQSVDGSVDAVAAARITLTCSPPNSDPGSYCSG